MQARNKLFIMSIALIGAIFGALVMGGINASSVNAQGTYEELRSFVDVLNVIKKNYVDEVKTKDLVTGAIKGMLTSLDPHSG